MTDIRTDEGWLYPAVVLDLFNLEVVGWSSKPRMMAGHRYRCADYSVVPQKACSGADPPSDLESQYAGLAFQERV